MSKSKEIKNKIKKSFDKLVFNAEHHTYFVNGKRLPSVSSLVKEYTTPFEADKIAGFVAKKRGITKEQVLAEWKEKGDKAMAFGTKVHNFAEAYSYGEDVTPSNPHEIAVVRFWEDLPDYYQPIFFELKMYSDEYEYAGTSDFILLNTKDFTLVPGDYKTNKNLFKKYGNYLKPPFKDLKDISYNKYQIQLSLYQILIEEIGYKVNERLLVWLKDDGNYNLFRTDDLTKKLRDASKGNNTKDPEFIF